MRILSLSGGGIRGIYQGIFLRDLAGQIGRPLHECFDLIAGTSTGAIIALAVALDIPPEKIVKLFEEMGPKVFPQRVKESREKNRNYLWKGPFYNSEPLIEALRDAFAPKSRYFQIKDCKTKVIIPSTTLDKYEMRVFSNIPALGADDGLYAADVALASAAAPTYFSSHQPEGIDASNNKSREERAYADGGLWANNPVLCAAMAAKRHMQADFTDMRILSIGNGRTPNGSLPVDFDKQRRAILMKNVIDMMLVTQAELADETVATLVGDESCSGLRMLKVNTDLPRRIDLDDVSVALTLLKPRAENDARRHTQSIKSLLNV